MKATTKQVNKTSIPTKDDSQKVSKTQLAMQKNKNGAGGKILDMTVVLKQCLF